MASGAKIEVKGLQHIMRALRIVDDSAVKAVQVGFKEAAAPILAKAKERVPQQPMSGWGEWDGGRRDWDPTAVKRGLRTQMSLTKRRFALRLVSANAAGAVFENAGSRTPKAPFNRGIAKSAQKVGYPEKPGRLLVYTWKQEKGIKQMHIKVGKLIDEAVDRYRAKVR